MHISIHNSVNLQMRIAVKNQLLKLTMEQSILRSQIIIQQKQESPQTTEF